MVTLKVLKAKFPPRLDARFTGESFALNGREAIEAIAKCHNHISSMLKTTGQVNEVLA